MTKKLRYRPQAGELIEDIKFSEWQIEALKKIKDDDAFVAAILGIAEFYVARNGAAEEGLNSTEVTDIIKDVKRQVVTLEKCLDSLPSEADALLWRFTMNPHKDDVTPKVEQLKALLTAFADEIDEVMDKGLPKDKRGRKEKVAEWLAVDLLRECFERFGLPVTVNSWPDSAPSVATVCLDMIFNAGMRKLNRSGIEEYLKPVKG